MITILKVITIKNGKDIVEGTCLSSDTKPTNFGNGSIFLEMDTSTFVMFNEESSELLALE